MPHKPVLVALVVETVGRWRLRHMRARTRYLIRELPSHLQEDIGWPEAVHDRARRKPPGMYGL